MEWRADRQSWGVTKVTVRRRSLGECKSQLLWFIINPLNLLVLTLYHPYWGNSSFHSIVLDLLINIVCHCRLHHSVQFTLLCGDFNGLSGSVDNLNALLGTSCVFQSPTRGAAQLDHILSDSPNSYLTAVISAPLGRSDHNVIFCPSLHQPTLPIRKKVQFRVKSPAACAGFHKELSTAAFLQNILSEEDVNKATSIFLDSLSSLFNKFFPLRSVQLRSDDKPWMKPSLKHLINRRDRAFKERKTLKYFRLRELVIHHASKLRRDYLQSAIDTRNSTTVWRSLNKLVCRDRNAYPEPDPAVLKSVFSSVFVPYNEVPQSFLTVADADSPSLPLRLSLTDTLNAMASLRKGSPGPDGLPHWLFRDYRNLLAPALHHVCVLSVSSGIFPDAFKHAHVVPIPKCSNPSISDYRPISLVSVASKVLEKMVLKKWFSSIVPRLEPLQFAFIPRPGQGTIAALTYILHRVLAFLDSPGAVRILMVDYSKAFDKIPHKTILSSAISLGAPKELVKWISSYLHSRKYIIKSNNSFSQPYISTSGVPQGGVLSPIIFAQAVDSLKPCFENSVIVKFADDICLLHFVRNATDDHLSEELENIISWSSQHGLLFNNNKTKLMDVQTKQSLVLSPLNVSHSSDIIQNVSTAKLLGLLIDNDMSWSSHISEALSKARKRVFMLYSLKRIRAPKSIMWTVYCSMIRSVITYAYPAWCNITKSQCQLLSKFEERICKIFDLPRTKELGVFCDSLGKRLALKALNVSHPLHIIYDKKASRYSNRLGHLRRGLRTRTKRYKNSFIKYAVL